MGYLLIGCIYDNNNSAGYRILDDNTGRCLDIKNSELISEIKNGRIYIDNAELTAKNDLKGTNGSLDRYPKLDINGTLLSNTRLNPVIIIGKIDDNRYKVCNYLGEIRTMHKESLIEYAKIAGIANGKITNKNGSDIISSISGEYRTIKMETEIDSILSNYFNAIRPIYKPSDVSDDINWIQRNLSKNDIISANNDKFSIIAYLLNKYDESDCEKLFGKWEINTIKEFIEFNIPIPSILIELAIKNYLYNPLTTLKILANSKNDRLIGEILTDISNNSNSKMYLYSVITKHIKDANIAGVMDAIASIEMIKILWDVYTKIDNIMIDNSIDLDIEQVRRLMRTSTFSSDKDLCNCMLVISFAWAIFANLTAFEPMIGYIIENRVKIFRSLTEDRINRAMKYIIDYAISRHNAQGDKSKDIKCEPNIMDYDTKPEHYSTMDWLNYLISHNKYNESDTSIIIALDIKNRNLDEKRLTHNQKYRVNDAIRKLEDINYRRIHDQAIQRSEVEQNKTYSLAERSDIAKMVDKILNITDESQISKLTDGCSYIINICKTIKRTKKVSDKQINRILNAIDKLDK